ncbi:unnamed protein product [Polarella glacialis]|uniref:Peptidyl-prolyl cis-trans isomerase n=1 Tax=Polarella glacialis TaxID=89957 RepID=A0A813K8M8_POLGL|nr:unnamed protein product [Polarella glacialis]
MVEPAIDIFGVPVPGIVIFAVSIAVILIAYQACFGEAFSGGGAGRSCTGRHILMGDEEDLKKAKARIKAGEEFGTVAKECSTCPSGQNGGSLGTFSPGQMVPAFDRVCFNPDSKVGEMYTVETQFGFHLIIVDARKGVDPEEPKEEPKEEKVKEEKKAK